MKIFNARNDFQYKLSKKTKEENYAVIEKVKNMMKKQKIYRRCMVWSSFVDKLTFKASGAGREERYWG